MSRKALGCWVVSRRVSRSASGSDQYRGLDRTPPLPGPDEDSRLSGEGRNGLLEVRDRYWRLEDEGRLHSDFRAAVAVRDVLNREGVSVELIQAEIVSIPDLSTLPLELKERFEKGLARWCVKSRPHDAVEREPLGIDVTYPFPSFHSAIRQPMTGVGREDWESKLNRYGLFASAAEAETIAAICNSRETNWRPFCPVEIFLVR